MEQVLDFIRTFPGILQWRKNKYKKKFSLNDNHNLFYGVYKSFNDARTHIPSTKPVGYNHKAAANMYSNLVERIRLVDYPVIFWMNEIIDENSVVFDFGGHIGIRFYSYSKYISFPEKFQWYVYDLPSIIKEGKKIAAEKGEERILFTDKINLSGKENIFFASGSLQYFEEPVYSIINKNNLSPKHVIINGFPLHEKHEFVTINNMGTAYCPYKIYNKDKFIKKMIENGYELVDIWNNTARDKNCHIPFNDDYNGSIYYGLYFIKK